MAIAQADLYTLAVQAGLKPARARIAAAIAISESGGDPNAHNTKGPDNSYGLWQINMKGALGPARLKQFGIASADQLLDPATNARAMATLSKQGSDFRPWSTYLSGAYLTHIGADLGANPGVVDVGFWDRLKKGGGKLLDLIPTPGDVLGSALAPFATFGQLVEIVVKGAQWVSDSSNWVRVGYVVMGGALALAGVVMVLKDTSAGRTATAGAKTAAKVVL